MAAASRRARAERSGASAKGFSEDDYNVTIADQDGEIKKMLLKLKEVGKAPEFVAQQLTNLDKDVRSTRSHAQKRRDQVAADTAELKQIEAQLTEASAKVAALQKRKSESDAAAKRLETHLNAATGELTGHVKSANRQRKTVLNKQEAATAKYTRGQLAAERGYDSAARVPTSKPLTTTKRGATQRSQLK